MHMQIAKKESEKSTRVYRKVLFRFVRGKASIFEVLKSIPGSGIFFLRHQCRFIELEPGGFLGVNKDGFVLADPQHPGGTVVGKTIFQLAGLLGQLVDAVSPEQLIEALEGVCANSSMHIPPILPMSAHNHLAGVPVLRAT